MPDHDIDKLSQVPNCFILNKKKKIADWIDQNNFETVIFENPYEFCNINSKQDLQKIETK